MSTRRRIGVSVATTEAARRQVMQPVICWEKVWTIAENTGSNSSVKIYKWVKTKKKQQFSDEEGEVDEPLAPLPDEPEVVEGDEEIEQDEPAIPLARDALEASGNSVVEEEPLNTVLSLQSAEPCADMLEDESLKVLEVTMVIENENAGDVDETETSFERIHPPPPHPPPPPPPPPLMDSFISNLNGDRVDT